MVIIELRSSGCSGQFFGPRVNFLLSADHIENDACNSSFVACKSKCGKDSLVYLGNKDSLNSFHMFLTMFLNYFMCYNPSFSVEDHSILLIFSVWYLCVADFDYEMHSDTKDE